MIDFVSVNGLSGGFELGLVQTGEFELIHRSGSLDLGAPVVEANRKLLGWNWDSLFSKKPEHWTIKSAPFIAANPPCSAWSTLTRKDLRGADAKVMSCTDEVFDYAGLMYTPPELIAIESVQQAFSTGRAYYQQKREELEENTGKKYDLIWIMQSNAATGGASVRKRVFVCYSAIPFGVEYAQPKRVARLGDAIRDLEGLALTASKQPYRRPATWWSVARRSKDGVDGHFTIPSSEDFSQLVKLSDKVGKPWKPGDQLQDALRRVHESGEILPHQWQRNVDKLIAKNFTLGINQTRMWDPEKMGPVVTGGGPNLSVHYAEPRLLTHRECFRLQGFPDTWRLWPVRHYKKLALCPGKGVPVDAGRWMGVWAANSLQGSPGTVQGEKIGERERKIDITGSYRWTVENEMPWRYTSHTIHDQSDYREEMDYDQMGSSK